jgi:hypothetical protein
LTHFADDAAVRRTARLAGFFLAGFATFFEGFATFFAGLPAFAGFRALGRAPLAEVALLRARPDFRFVFAFTAG